MCKKIITCMVLCSFMFLLYGCAVRTYTVTKERVDQDLSVGNRGYLLGKSAVSEERDRKTTREIQVIEIEAHPIRFGKKTAVSVPKKAGQIQELEVQPQTAVGMPVIPSKKVSMKKYTVGKGDTLQKISKKFYGTTKRWMDIYNANKGVLKSPNDIYPGQVIDIPIEEIKGVK